MLINFSVLWIEDDTNWYNASRRPLKRFLDGLGFNLETTRIANPEETDWEQHFENTAQYDLMLVDWRVQDTNKVDKPVGGDVIAKIREQIPYSDILFYSGSDGLDKEVYEKKLQGVYTAQRSKVRREAEELIEHLLHKTLHPKIMRGIIVSSLSQIDDLCFKIIERKFYEEGCDKTAFARAFKDSIKKQAKAQIKDKEKKFELDNEEFISCLSSTLLLDSFKRAQKTFKIAQADLSEGDQRKLEALPETVRKRNWLAHWKRVEETDKHISLTDGDGQEYLFDQSEAVVMRKNINSAADVLTRYLASLPEKPA